MKIVYDIPEEVADCLIEFPDIGRVEMSNKLGISEHESRIYSHIWKGRLTDSSPKVLGLGHILQERTNKQTAQIKQLQKHIATEGELLNKIAECIPSLKLPRSLPEMKLGTNGKDTREAIFIWSDWHAFEVVESDQMEGFNSYNMKVLLGRLWNLVRGCLKIVESSRRSYDIDVLNIDLLGDMVSGDIHQELRETNELPQLQTVLLLAHVTAQAVAMLAPHFEKIRMFGLVGNHGRTTIKPVFKNKILTNYDYLFYQILSMYLRDYIKEGKLEFNIPISSECVTIRKDWAFLLGHSDQIKAWSGFPVYGFFRDNAKQQKLRKLRSVLSKNDFDSKSDINGAIANMETARNISGYDYREAGHWHQYMLLDDGSTIINPSLIGGNEWSKDKMHSISSPRQLILTLSEKWGLKSVESVYCSDHGHGFHTFTKGAVLGEMSDYITNVIGEK